MQNREKTIAAISAGVAYYLQEEQEAAQLMQQERMQEQQPSQPRGAFPVNSPWAMSGRQAIMERRYQWQFRLVR
jgi:hypothetical protein